MTRPFLRSSTIRLPIQDSTEERTLGPLQERFESILVERYPIVWRGVKEARAVAPELVDREWEKVLGWITRSFGEDVLGNLVDGYAFFTMEVNRAQVAYERAGKYKLGSFAEANRLVYQQPDYMRHYYWGVLAVTFCWGHHVELIDFYLNRFVAGLSPGRVLEVAPGHGLWGLLALDGCQGTTLEGWDISPTSLEWAPRMAEGAQLAARTTYRVEDATRVSDSGERFDAAVCCFMLEHLEDPRAFLRGLSDWLEPGARAFVTLALTAAQPDHIYEFLRESEAISMAEDAGFELLEARIARPQRLLPSARFVPRVQAMILRKR